MGMNIKSDDTHRRAKELARITGETIAEADSPLISAATLLELHFVMLNRHGARAARSSTD